MKKTEPPAPPMSHAEHEERRDYLRRQERRARFKTDLAKCVASQEYQEPHPRPWTCEMVIHDGPGAQFFDANGKPVLQDLIRDPEDAAQLLFSANSGT